MVSLFKHLEIGEEEWGDLVGISESVGEGLFLTTLLLKVGVMLCMLGTQKILNRASEEAQDDEIVLAMPSAERS